MIFSISAAPDKADKISLASFAGLSIWERRHIEEWIRVSPEILGEDLLVLTIEFDRFVSSSDRLDILALDRRGNLVVVELKRDSAAGLRRSSSDQICSDGFRNDHREAAPLLHRVPEEML